MICRAAHYATPLHHEIRKFGVASSRSTAALGFVVAISYWLLLQRLGRGSGLVLLLTTLFMYENSNLLVSKNRLIDIPKPLCEDVYR
jgi:hypothetical protein